MRRLAPLWVGLAALLVRLATGPHPIDDAYITFRYARNLAEGYGLVYNTGEWVLGTTTPIWATLLAFGYHVGLTDLPRLALGVSAVCDGLTAALIVLLALRMGWQVGAASLVGLAWALNPLSIGFASGGMEASLFALMALGALTLAAGGAVSCADAMPASDAELVGTGAMSRLSGTGAIARPSGRGAMARLGISWRVLAAALIAGTSVFVRPEGALLAAVVVLWTMFARRGQGPFEALRQGVLSGSVAAVPVAVGGVLLTRLYGSPIPHSMAAKQVAYVLGSPFDNVLALLMQAGLPGWTTSVLSRFPAAVSLAVVAFGLVTLIFLVKRGVPRLQCSQVPWQPYAGFAVLYLVFYTVAGVRGVRLFPWYLVPLAPFYLLGAAAGLKTLTQKNRLALMAAAGLVAWQLPAVDWTQPLMPLGTDTARERALLEVGHQLAATLPSSTVVAAPEIGAVGYASGLRVLDTVGLVSPVAVPYYPLPSDQVLTDNAIPPRLILDEQPDVVVTLDAFAQKSLLADSAFAASYTLQQRVPVDVWQSHELLMFRRTDLVAADR